MLNAEPTTVELLNIGIAVYDLEGAAEQLTGLLGLVAEQGPTTLEDLKVRTFALYGQNFTIELISPISNDGPVAAFLERRGEGLYRLAFGSPRLEAVCRNLAGAGIRQTLLPASGPNGEDLCFSHPKDLYGVLLEFVGPKPAGPEQPPTREEYPQGG